MATGDNAGTLRQTQIGVQNTLFTAVGANLLLQSVDIMPEPVHGQAMLYGTGQKGAIGQVSTKGCHTKAKVQGFGAYIDLIYLMSALLKAGTLTTPGGATLARDWTWTIVTRSAETPKYLTVENGISGVDWSRFADASLLGLKMAFEQNKEVAITGDMVGTLLAEEGVTATANPTIVNNVPISVGMMDAYVADTISGLSSGLLGSMYKCDLSMGDRRSMLFPIRSDRPSFGGLAEKRNKITAHIEIEHDTQSYNMMRQLRAARTRYLRFTIVGPLIESGQNFTFEFTMPFKVINSPRGTQDEVYQGMYDLEAVHDATLGGLAQVRIRAGISALTTSTDLLSAQQPATIIAGLTAPGFS